MGGDDFEDSSTAFSAYSRRRVACARFPSGFAVTVAAHLSWTGTLPKGPKVVPFWDYLIES